VANPDEGDGDGDGVGDVCEILLPVENLSARPKRSKVSLVWTADADAVSSNIYRATTSGGPYQLIASGHVSGYATYLDAQVTTGNTYYLRCDGLTRRATNRLTRTRQVRRYVVEQGADIHRQVN
jgi:hypothetical protein